MIELSNNQAQTIAPGGSVTFDKVRYQSRRGCECFNEQVPTSVKLCANGVYELHFSGNITGEAAATLQLALAIGNQPLPQTAMNAKPAAANDLWNVSTATLYDNSCCDVDRVSVVNAGAVPITLAPNSSFFIVRQA